MSDAIGSKCLGCGRAVGARRRCRCAANAAAGHGLSRWVATRDNRARAQAGLSAVQARERARGGAGGDPHTRASDAVADVLHWFGSNKADGRRMTVAEARSVLARAMRHVEAEWRGARD